MEKNRLESFRKWSEKTGIPVEEIVSRYNAYLQEYKDEAKAFKKIRVEISDEHGSLFSNAVPFYGYLMGDSGLYDWSEIMRERAERLWNSDRREEAIREGIISPEGLPLDTRRTRFGRPNPKFGMPLTEPEFQRDLFGVVSSTPDFETVRLAYIIATGENAENFKDIELFKWFRFRATVGKARRDSNVIRLNVGKATKFQEISPDLTPEELANKLEFFDVEEDILSRIYEDKFSRRGSQYIASFRGDAVELRLEPVRNYRVFYLVSEGEELLATRLKCRVPVQIPVLIHELDKVQVFGRLWRDRLGHYTIDVKGYIPLGG